MIVIYILIGLFGLAVIFMLTPLLIDQIKEYIKELKK